MKTITNKNETLVISANIQVRISEEIDTIYIDVLENRVIQDNASEKQQVITNSISVPKDRALNLELDYSIES